MTKKDFMFDLTLTASNIRQMEEYRHEEASNENYRKAKKSDWYKTLTAIRYNKPVFEYVFHQEGTRDDNLRAVDFSINGEQVDYILKGKGSYYNYLGQWRYEDTIKRRVKKLSERLIPFGISACSDCGDVLDIRQNACQCKHSEWVSFPNRYNEKSYKAFQGTTGKRNTYKMTEGMEYTFGVEFETKCGKIPPHLRSLLDIKCVRDGSVRGGEYVTGVLKGDEGFEKLGFIIEQLNMYNHKVDHKCGLHVHIGGAHFNRKFSALAIRLAYQLQDHLFNMQPPSRQHNNYCPKISNVYKSTNFKNGVDRIARYVFDANKMDRGVNKKRDLGRYPSTRYKWLNLIRCNSLVPKGTETIEFRLHSGTINREKTFRWIQICMSIVNFIENNPRLILQNKVSLSEVIHEGLPLQHEEIIAYINRRIKKFSGKDKMIQSRGARFGFAVHRFNFGLSDYLKKQENGLTRAELEKQQWHKMKESLTEIKKARKQFRTIQAVNETAEERGVLNHL
jgi:hypothetical protein